MKLGVFDSGIGGEAIAQALRTTFPGAQIETVSDREHVPYGDKPPTEVRDLAEIALQPLLVAGDCHVIILACNTATAVAIEYLRDKYPSQKFIGVEPMIKPAAAHTKSGVVAVCATPATLASQRYKQLVQTYGSTLEIIEPDCKEWAYLIENSLINRAHIDTIIENALQHGADVIVLGCTHYHWIKEMIEEIVAGRAAILEPSEAIGQRVKYLLRQIAE